MLQGNSGIRQGVVHGFGQKVGISRFVVEFCAEISRNSSSVFFKFMPKQQVIGKIIAVVIGSSEVIGLVKQCAR